MSMVSKTKENCFSAQEKTYAEADSIDGAAAASLAFGAERSLTWKGMLKPESKRRASRLVLAVVVKVTSNPVILGNMSKLFSISGNNDIAEGGNPMPMFPVASPADSGNPGHSFILGSTTSTSLSKNWYILSPFSVTLHPIGFPIGTRWKYIG